MSEEEESKQTQEEQPKEVIKPVPHPDDTEFFNQRRRLQESLARYDVRIVCLIRFVFSHFQTKHYDSLLIHLSFINY